MKKILLNLYYKVLKIKDYFIIGYNKQLRKQIKLKVIDTDKTMDKILEDKCSVSRFGDGEFGLLSGNNLIFQPYTKEIEERLNRIIIEENKNHIVCIPNIFDDLSIYTAKAQVYWNKYLNLNYHRFVKKLNKRRKYYDALVTRVYMDTFNKENVGMRFKKLQKMWEDKNIVIVEGNRSRLGIGNDLFSNANTIKRIIAPSHDAFSSYQDILEEVKKQQRDRLILIALGPTATILAYDLAQIGYQAIDIGHIDIEYEWFLQGATEKVPVKNKYIGEIEGGSKVDELNDRCYEEQIIAVIK